MTTEPKNNKKRKIGFMKGSGSLSDNFDNVDAELDQEVLKLFYPNETTSDTISKSERGEGIHKATSEADLFKKLGI